MADTAIEHAERIATLETKVDVLTKAVEGATSKIDDLLSIVQQARGARYALMGAGGIIGSLITFAALYAGKIGSVVQAISR